MANRCSFLPVVFGIMILVFVGAGCSSTGGSIGHGILTEVQLSQANFDVVKSVSGEAQADYFFGMGPSDQDLVGRAKRAMIDSAQLKGSQAIANVTTDIKMTWFPFWHQRKAYVSGEVIQFK